MRTPPKQGRPKKQGMKGMSVRSGDLRRTAAGAGMSTEGIKKYRRQNPGSKLKPAVNYKQQLQAK